MQSGAGSVAAERVELGGDEVRGLGEYGGEPPRCRAVKRGYQCAERHPGSWQPFGTEVTTRPQQGERLSRRTCRQAVTALPFCLATTDRSHFRSGAALNYVLAGTGLFTAEGKTEGRTPGTADFELNGLVYQWANSGDTPLVLLQANLSQEGMPAVAPAKHKIAMEAMERSLGAKLLPLITG